MNEYISNITYRFQKMLSNSDMSRLKSKLASVDGIESIEISPVAISIDYLNVKLAGISVKEDIQKLGYPLKQNKEKPVGWIKRFIENLASSNKKSFGNKKLDCCDLK